MQCYMSLLYPLGCCKEGDFECLVPLMKEKVSSMELQLNRTSMMMMKMTEKMDEMRYEAFIAKNDTDARIRALEEKVAAQPLLLLRWRAAVTALKHQSPSPPSPPSYQVRSSRSLLSNLSCVLSLKVLFELLRPV